VVVAVALVVLAVLGAIIFGIVYSVKGKNPPTLLIVSLDGFRYDYLGRGLTPNILALGKGTELQTVRLDFWGIGLDWIEKLVS